jgi:hypothetical protein
MSPLRRSYILVLAANTRGLHIRDHHSPLPSIPSGAFDLVNPSCLPKQLHTQSVVFLGPGGALKVEMNKGR